MSFPGVVIPKITATPIHGAAPLEVSLSVSVDEYDEIIETHDPESIEGEIVERHAVFGEEIIEVQQWP